MIVSLVDLQGGLDSESVALQELLEVLEAERDILLKPGVEGLHALLERKIAAVGHVSELTRQRYSVLAALDFSSDESGMQACVSSFSGDPAADKLEKEWKALGATAEKIKACNHFNGQLVSRLMARNQELLAVFGMAAQEGGGLYGPDGRANPFGGSIRRRFTTG